MTKRRLGKTDIVVSPVGLGTWQFSQGAGLVGKFWASMDQEATTAVVEAALKSGISWFDTAEVYGNGKSELSLSAALSHLGVKPHSIGIATKWWPLFRTARSIGTTIEDRIAYMAPYPIDLYQVHQPLSFSSIGSQMKAMAALVKAGKVKAIGVSNFSASGMAAAHAALAEEGLPLASNQVRISLLDRSIESNGILETAKRLGLSLIAYSPLAQGMLTGRFHDDPAKIRSTPVLRRLASGLKPEAVERSRALIDELKSIGSAYGVGPAQVALNWILYYYGDLALVIPGASKPAQAEAAAAAMGFRLSDREIAHLDELSRKCQPS